MLTMKTGGLFLVISVITGASNEKALAIPVPYKTPMLIAMWGPDCSGRHASDVFEDHAAVKH
jgi:hypothetical protein